MQATIQKWGNSLALRIPSVVAEEIAVREGDKVELKIDAKCLVIRSARPSYRSSDLIRGITPKNLHKETDWGTTSGAEVW